jgi:hypothetical protein
MASQVTRASGARWPRAGRAGMLKSPRTGASQPGRFSSMPSRHAPLALVLCALAGAGCMSRSSLECWDCPAGLGVPAGGSPTGDDTPTELGGRVNGTGGLSNAGGTTNACPPGQWILVDEVLNARDLGGTVLGDGRTVACSQLYRGAVIANLTAEGCAEFAGLGVRTIVDLRTESERTSVPEAACAFSQARTVLAPMPIPYNVSAADYIADLDTTSSVLAAFAALGDPAAYPVYFHCTYGRDRSGVLAAVILLALGATSDAVMGEYELSIAGGVGAFPDSLQAVLDEIERRGGVETYLASAGVAGNELAALRARLIVE